MRKAEVLCAVIVAGTTLAFGLAGAPAEIRHLPEPSAPVDWPGDRPAGPVLLDSKGDPRAVETLRDEGTRFVVVPQSRSEYGDFIRVSATADRTVVRLNGRIAVTLDAGEDWRFTPGWRYLRIEATDPVVVSFHVVPMP